jgi:hypothetical protein
LAAGAHWAGGEKQGEAGFQGSGMPTGGGEHHGEEHHHGDKGKEMGKKFGKKLGNAAIFGAGATIGSNIVNSIF